MYEFIIDMNPISSFTHINWNKLLLKFFKLWKMESWHPKCNTLLCFHLEVVESYNRVLERKPMDALSMVIASNNLIAIKGGQGGNLFDSLKKSYKLLDNKGLGQKLQFAKGLNHRLSTRKKEAISFNRCLLLLFQISLVKLVSFWPYHYFIIIWSLCTNLSHS